MGAHPIRWVAIIGAVVVVLPLTLVFGSRLGKDPSLADSVLIGKPAPAFELETIDGETVSSADFAGRPYVVNFWASWCVPCRREHGPLTAFYERFKDEGVGLVGVMFNDTEAGARAYRDELGGTWPLVKDPGSRLALDYGVGGPPETFGVDARGIVIFKLTGAVQPGQLEGIFDSVSVPALRP